MILLIFVGSKSTATSVAVTTTSKQRKINLSDFWTKVCTRFSYFTIKKIN